MILGKVKGNIVSTIKAIGYDSRKVLIIQPIDSNRNPKGKTFLAVDTVQAGVGDTVITLEEGGSARMVINETQTYTIKAVVVGIVDAISKK